ncbi:MAG: hypothetical protein CYPHOPRED_001235 [Cyphobasidiales sp. Tagirdzhanova-0007]|nr:MAG: hypothetical protein CYPHOPRED_001235 [Cyphobasidiales sp. Tagirdzhanova-0007]
MDMPEYTALPESPVLADSERFLSERVDHRKQSATPLPRWQMLAYSGIRSSEVWRASFLLRALRLTPNLIWLNLVSQFISELLVEYGIAKDAASTGYAAGVLESSVWLANAASIPVWIRLADKYGRRPVLLGSTLATAFFGALVGFPRSFIGLLVLRVLTGLTNGQAGVSKTYLSELVDETNEATAFSLQSLAWQVGWCIAALVGGYLAHLERNIPSAGKAAFILEHPYALPTISMAIPPILSVLLGYFVLVETVEPSAGGKNSYEVIVSWTTPMWDGIKIFSTLCAVNIAFQACLPLFFYAPVKVGGLGLPTKGIGLWYACRAALIVCLEFPIYPPLHRHFGLITMLRGQVLLYPIVYAFCPVISICTRWAGHSNPLTFTLLACLMVLEAMSQTVFISADLICTNAAPSKSMQSEYNAAVETAAKLTNVAVIWGASWFLAAGFDICLQSLLCIQADRELEEPGNWIAYDTV